MSNLPINPLSPQEQQRLMSQMYLLMANQVKSYHKMRHNGENSSVPVELAQELMESIEYTINQVGGVYAHPNVEEALRLGQEILQSKSEEAKSLLDLVIATAPGWQTECRWEAVQCLRQYLGAYDPLHLAHKAPDDLFYPIPIPLPEGIQGLDNCLFYLNTLWMENQIMASYEDAVLERFWSYLPTDTLNQCEHVVLNGIGKAILSDRIGSLVFVETERNKLQAILSEAPIKETVHQAVLRLCRQLDLPENASVYLRSVATQMLPRLEVALQHDNLSAAIL